MKTVMSLFSFRFMLAVLTVAMLMVVALPVQAQNAEREAQLQEEIAAATGLNPDDIIIIADVNVYDATVVPGPESGQYTISFDLVNKGDVQPQVKYAIELVRATEAGETIVDKHVYDAELSLDAGASKSVSVVYDAPQTLKGEYIVRVIAANIKGLEYGGSTAGTIALDGVGGVAIDATSCFLQVAGDAARYNLTQGVDVATDEELTVQCDRVTNNADVDAQITPTFTTHERTEFGVVVETVKGEAETLAAGETKSLLFPVQKQEKPQSYEVVMNLGDSNDVNFRYVVQGMSATIQNASLDKAEYKKGDTAHINLFLSGSADFFPNARGVDVVRDSARNEQLAVSVDVMSGGAKCAATTKRVLTPEEYAEGGMVDIAAKITAACKNPTVKIVAMDDAGNTLDQNTFEVASKKEATGVLGGVTDKDDKALSGIVVAFLLVTFIIIAAILITRHKSAKALAFTIIASGALFAGTSVQAASFATGYNNNIQGWYQTSKSSYTQCEDVIAEARFQYTACANSHHDLRVTVDGQEVARVNYDASGQSGSQNTWNTGWQSVNLGTKTPGTHSIDFNFNMDRFYGPNHSGYGRDRSQSGHPIIQSPYSGSAPRWAQDWFCARCSGDRTDESRANDCPCSENIIDVTHSLNVTVTAAQCAPVTGPDCNQTDLTGQPTQASACTVGSITTPPGITGDGTSANPWRWTCTHNGQTSAECTGERATMCGNGIVEAGEQCDDGNTVSGDGCESDCTTPAPVCGNGVVEAGESCDDGGAAGGCDDSCGACVDNEAFICNNVCTTYELNGSNQVNLLRDGGAEDATVSVGVSDPRCTRPPLNCVLNNGQAVPNGGSVQVPITSHPANLEAECDDPDDPTKKKKTKGKTIQCVCTARRCTAAGTCAATPVFASSYSAGACSSNCSTNADCGSGNVIEVQP